MKFLLCFLLLLTISTINCFESIGCSIDSDCPFFHSCVDGHCIDIRGPIAHPRGFSEDLQHCDPECPPHLACLWGQCVDGRRRFQGLEWCVWNIQCGTFEFCILGKCVGL
ncbi:unnamed protein product [Caenorhabditis nigoni]